MQANNSATPLVSVSQYHAAYVPIVPKAETLFAQGALHTVVFRGCFSEKAKIPKTSLTSWGRWEGTFRECHIPLSY